MIYNEFVLNLMCCPKCQHSLALEEITEQALDGHVLTAALRCIRCHTDYPVVRGIPRFVEQSQTDNVAATIEGFGFQWNRTATLLENTRFSSPETFLDFINPPVQPGFFQSKVVLDAGCGNGRFTRHAINFGAEFVVGVDLSYAVEAAFEKTRHLPNVLIVQADLFRLPFLQTFDYAFSIGVLHHTSDPKGAFESVAELVTCGGAMSAWVYGRENNGWIVNVINPIRAHISSRLPHKLLLVLAFLLGVPVYFITRCIYKPVGRYDRLQRLRRFLFYFDYLYFLSQYGYTEQSTIIFDHLAPSLAEYVRREDFETWFHDMEGVVISSRANNSWRGFGMRLCDRC